MLSIEEQIKNMARKAWRDVIQDKLKSEEPDFEYVVNLYKEFRTKLIELVQNENKREYIKEKLDVELFTQMIKTDSFNRNDFYSLINYSFNICKTLGSPTRDDETDLLKNEVIKEFEKDIFCGISSFFLNINICIDWIYEDIIKVQENFEKAPPNGQL